MNLSSAADAAQSLAAESDTHAFPDGTAPHDASSDGAAPVAESTDDNSTVATSPDPTSSAAGHEVVGTGAERDARTPLAMHVEPTRPESPLPAPSGDADDGDSGEPALSSYPRCSDGQGTLAFLFFSDDDVDIARAKAICSTCGLREECLAGAIEREEPYGVWGGKLMVEGTPVEFKRRRGRPRKNPLPVLVVDEVPLPPHLVA